MVVALLEHQVAALRADGSRLRAEADGWAQAVKEAEQRVAELESRLKDAEAQAMRLRLDSHARRAQLAALSAEVALLRGQVEGMRRQRSAALSLAKPLVRRVLSKLLRRVRGGLLLGAAALALAVVATQVGGRCSTALDSAVQQWAVDAAVGRCSTGVYNASRLGRGSSTWADWAASAAAMLPLPLHLLLPP